MHYCAVKLCGHNTKSSGLRKDSISFHRFPKCPKIKEKWIEATKRPHDWFPTPNSVICSLHFKTEDFRVTKCNNKRFLYPYAVPTLHLPAVISCEGSTSATCQNTNVAASIITPDLPTAKSKSTATDYGVPSASSHSTVSPNIQPATDILASSSNSNSPRKKRLRLTIADLSFKLKQSKLKVKRLQTSNRVLRKKNTDLKSLLKELQDKQLITDEHTSILEHIGVQSSEILKRQIINAKSGKISRAKYSPELRMFALTLHFYSNKAYQYVRDTFHTCLPSPKTLSKWYQSVDGRPGFTKEAFNALKLKSDQYKQKLYGTLIFDEIKINSVDIEYNPRNQRTYGYVDFGGELETDCTEECSEALVFLVVPFNGSFKVPIGYFLVNKLNADQKASLITQAIRLCRDANFEVKALTFDGCPTNTSAVKKLGCDFDPRNLKTTFNVDDSEIMVFLDPVHMIKLIRNSFEFYRELKDGDGNLIRWEYVEKLHEFQEKETFHLANKLRLAHIDFKTNVMKVKLATQIFSRSVATALEFCNTQLKLKEFQGVEGTVKMLMILNDIFDILDSKTHGYGFKCAMNKNNYVGICQRMDEVKQYLLSLTVHENSQRQERNVPLIKSRRFTGFLGLCICIESAKVLFQHLVENDACHLTYLPLHKISQDHIELFFCNVRSAGGCNNNPTPLQFEGIYKKMLIHTELQQSKTGNCIPLENISILNCSSVDRINITTERTKNFLQNNMLEEHEDDMDIAVQETSLSVFAENIIEYISGFVVKSLIRRLKCSKCIGSLTSSNRNIHSFVFARDQGGLIYPSEMVIKICRRCETVIKSNDTYKTVKPNCRPVFIMTKTLQSLVNDDLFSSDLLQHQFDHENTNHIIDLTKSIIEKYTNVRLAYLTRKMGPGQKAIRRVFTKLIHFKGQ